MSVTSVRRALLAALLIACLSSRAARARRLSRHDATEASIIRAHQPASRASYGLPRLRTNRGARPRRRRPLGVDAAHATRSATARYAQRVRRYVRARKVGENLAWMARLQRRTRS